MLYWQRIATSAIFAKTLLGVEILDDAEEKVIWRHAAHYIILMAPFIFLDICTFSYDWIWTRRLYTNVSSYGNPFTCVLYTRLIWRFIGKIFAWIDHRFMYYAIDSSKNKIRKRELSLTRPVLFKWDRNISVINSFCYKFSIFMYTDLYSIIFSFCLFFIDKIFISMLPELCLDTARRLPP